MCFMCLCIIFYSNSSVSNVNCIIFILAHPSCMDYSVELTSRIRADGGSWQCIDCKACVMCHDSGDPVRLENF